jgi:ATP-binding cassette subfamily B (MDR/TAP) protein 1
MDEGTSALDATTEKKVQRGLDAECEGKTMISIAHRLETISNSDLILVFSEGRLMEKGKYRDLMKRRSFFFQFATGQKLSS